MPKSKQHRSDLVTCDQCGAVVRARGLVSHTESCTKKEQEWLEDEEFAGIVRKAEKKGQCSIHSSDVLDILYKPTHQLDDIQVKYHPHSQLPPSVHHFSEFSRSCPMEAAVPRNNSPWEPFCTRLDFEIAEIALEAAMTKEQTNRLLSLVHQSASGKDAFTLQNHDEVHSLWDLAFQHYTRFVRFIDELWTADVFWNVQSHLPLDAKPLVFILYADKNKLLSFGSQKGYPIIACIVNLPVHIRNSNTTVGGGRVVGWLPIIVENQKHTKKKKYVDFKNAVWHASFYQLLASVVKHSNTGFCADYEEQCVMALIWGLKGKFPCPICLVPQDQQSVLGTYELCTSRQSEDILHTARSMPSEKEKENHLKAFSLQNVQNVFSRILHTDVHHALSFDCLHTNEEGLWCNHLWKETKFWILGQNFDTLPRWSNLTHFSSVMAVDFTDGTVLGDPLKIIIFAAQDILSLSHCKLGYLLLCCIRYYIEFDVYASFKVHMEDTIAAGMLALQKFLEIMGEYITESQPKTMKNWNFPKKHLISHVFDDILAKGMTRNYSTKPNEKMHGSVQKIYLQCTNFKNVASQILHYDEWLLTSMSMRIKLDELDEYNQRDSLDPETNEILPDAGNLESTTVHAYLGSSQGNHSFSDIMHLHGTNRAFTDFWMKLNSFLNGFLPQNDIPLPDGRCIHLHAEDMVTEFWFLCIHYESLVGWCMHQDLLRCNLKFYGSPRYDCVLVSIADKPFFARFMYMFSCLIGGTDFPLALIYPYDVSIPSSHQRRDNDLGLWRVRAKPRSSSEIISVQSIIQGVALANDPETPGDYFVTHTVDNDIFLRIKALQAQPL
ncbi:hypothetical protein BDR03DRAFT_993845 [Suillus americanus]|nr:hypothetical protein BDR03DRAFT_993845 [Suillus americanus]